MTPYEIVGVLFGLLSVYLTVRRSIWCWPAGIVSVLAFMLLFYEIKLYADMCLQVFFLVTSVQGWYLWLHDGDQRTPLPITRLTRGQVVVLSVALVACVSAVGYVFDTYTDAHIPFWDASTSGLSVLAQLLLVRKKLESWYLWVAVDLLSIGIYAYKQVYLTASLYVLFLVLATMGLIAWRRSLSTDSSWASSCPSPTATGTS